MYKMNYHTDIVNFLEGCLLEKGRLLERGAYFENLTFWRGAYLIFYCNHEENYVIKTPEELANAKNQLKPTG